MSSTAKDLYASLGRIAYGAVKPLLKVYVTPKHHRVRVVILNDQNEILLVRSWLGHQRWSLPGGGMRRLETPRQAALREVLEETGLALRDVEQLGTFTNPYPDSRYTVACFMTTIPKQEPLLARYRRLEVLDIGWFPLDKLPKNYSLTVDAALALRPQ
ncbi:MAG TPA: NUDIX hydrolase [Candidatus Saccharimonadales bacterium]|nr:NUDIX hydrolase [Candidatus Saccharimonadales bacterium]